MTRNTSIIAGLLQVYPPALYDIHMDKREKILRAKFSVIIRELSQ